MPDKPRLLLIDDGLEYARVIAEHVPEVELLYPYGKDAPPRLPDGPAAIEYLDRAGEHVDVALLDMRFEVEAERLFSLGDGFDLKRTKRFQGLAILRELRHSRPDLPVVLLTAQRDLAPIDAGQELAAQSMTYILDGDDLDTLRVRINAALSRSRAEDDDNGVLWGSDLTMRNTRRRLQVMARGQLPVLLEGETGTGKSFIAERFVHAQSGRDGPFVVADLAAIPTDLVAAHLFGAMRGAFTGAVTDRRGVFELAHGGTLFLDEVQNIPLDVQKQLLVVLQDRRVRPLGAAKEREVDVKIVASSNEPLDRAVRAGTFRQDLYMRLGPATRVRIPPLRERRRDLAFFATRLVAAAGSAPDISALLQVLVPEAGAPRLCLEILGKEKCPPELERDALTLALAQAAWRQLERHEWPGNLRELAFVLHNLVTFTLVEAADAVQAGLPLTASRLQIDPGLVGELLDSSRISIEGGDGPQRGNSVCVCVEPAETLNAVSVAVERQYFTRLYEESQGDFAVMAERLLGDSAKARAVQLRFNQIGLKVRQMRKR